jgi:hypothetical protein
MRLDGLPRPLPKRQGVFWRWVGDEPGGHKRQPRVESTPRDRLCSPPEHQRAPGDEQTSGDLDGPLTQEFSSLRCVALVIHSPHKGILALDARSCRCPTDAEGGRIFP